MIAPAVAVKRPYEFDAGHTSRGGNTCPVFSWLAREEIEDGAWDQIVNIASLPNALHVGVMVDCHRGYGPPIGSVLALDGAVAPNALGPDIGCGMIAQPMGVDVRALREIDPDWVRTFLVATGAVIPAGDGGFKKGGDRNQGLHKGRQDSEVLREWVETDASEGYENNWGLRERLDRHLGTLGAGNHFFEAQVDDNGQVWLMVHSGSRGFGAALFRHHQEIAMEINKAYRTPLPQTTGPEALPFLAVDRDEGQAYLRDMTFALRFAEESRKKMMYAAFQVFCDQLRQPWPETKPIETMHNFASIEKHLGREMVVHRKGAVRTVDAEGQPVLVTIPGSMQTGSYIGKGKPSKLALNTCSHGAGRVLGRAQARKAFGPGYSVKTEMEAAGLVLICPDTSDTSDEAGRAYKNIEDIMAKQDDLVDPVVHLMPLGTIKG